MNSGYFFSLDVEKSRLGDNLTVFNYTNLPAYVGEDIVDTPRYPISMIIGSNSIKVTLQYSVYKLKGKNKYYNCFDHIKKDTTKWGNGELEIYQMAEELFELPFSVYDKHLTSIVKKLYCSEFPIVRNKSSQFDIKYIEYLLGARYEGVNILIDGTEQGRELDKKNILIDGTEQDRELDKKNICYASLKVWGLKNKDGLYDLRKSAGRNFDKFLRKLLLDFLFDLKHSVVFQNSGSYGAMMEGLESNFFVSSIIKKSEFFYQSALVKHIKQNNPEVEYDIYADYLDRAEREWIDCIMSPEAENHFKFVPSWFEETEKKEEAEKKEKTGLIAGFLKNFKEPLFEIDPDAWFVQPEEEMQRIVFNLPEKEGDKYTIDEDLIFNSYELNIKQEKQKTADKKQQKVSLRIYPDLAEREKKISQWFIRRYDFADTYRLMCAPLLHKYSKYANKILIGVLMALSLMFVLSPRLTEAVFPVLLFALGAFAVYAITVKAFNRVKFSIHLHHFYPRLIASITAAWMTLAFDDKLFRVFFDEKWSITTMIFIVLLLVMFVHYEVDKVITKKGVVVKMSRALELILISFVISVFVGICVINFAGEKLLERSGIIEEVLALEVDPEIENEYKSFDIKTIVDSTKLADEETLIDMVSLDTSKVYSIIDAHPGRYVDALEGLKLKDNDYPVASKIDVLPNYHVFILWDFLIQFAFVALFIGIFLQMIFEEKNITES